MSRKSEWAREDKERGQAGGAGTWYCHSFQGNRDATIGRAWKQHTTPRCSVRNMIISANGSIGRRGPSRDLTNNGRQSAAVAFVALEKPRGMSASGQEQQAHPPRKNTLYHTYFNTVVLPRHFRVRSVLLATLY